MVGKEEKSNLIIILRLENLEKQLKNHYTKLVSIAWEKNSNLYISLNQ